MTTMFYGVIISKMPVTSRTNIRRLARLGAALAANSRSPSQIGLSHFWNHLLSSKLIALGGVTIIPGPMPSRSGQECVSVAKLLADIVQKLSGMSFGEILAPQADY